MLQTIHDKLKGWLAGVVLGAIGLVFIFWGINWTLGAPNYAAKVNGSQISTSTVRDTYQRQLAQFEKQTGAPLDEVMRNEIKKRVMDEYVNSEAVLTRADDLGYRVSDADIQREAAKIPAFQVDGKYDAAHAVAMLKAQGRSVVEIEDMLRRDVKLQQLDAALGGSSFATNTELKQLRTLTRQQREVSWMTLLAPRFAADATPDEAAVQTYYEAHKSEYMTPETVNLRYVEISLAQLAATVKVDDAQLKTYFDEQKVKSPERYAQGEQRRVRHILFQVTDPKDDAAAKAKAESVLKRVQAGEDFAKLAKEFSQDPGSAAQGGDLGFSERKVWVAPFGDAAYSMKLDEVRGPVKTQFGYHILRLDGIQAATSKTFEQAKPDLEPEYKRNEAERLFGNAQDQLADAALQNTTDIDVVARKAGLTVKDIPNFSRIDGGGELGKAPAVIEAAFSQDVLDGRLSQIVEVEKGRGVVVRATDHKMPQQKPLDAVRPAVVAGWKKQRGAELAAAAGADAVKRLRAGESLSAVAKQLNVGVEPPKFVARQDQSVPIEIRTSAFEAAKPAGTPLYNQVSLAGGDVAVYAVSAVREDPNGDAKQQDQELRRQYSQQLASVEAQSYAAAARAQAKISINPQAIE